MPSLLIKNGHLVDGTGDAPRAADLLIEGDRVAAIAESIEQEADVTIDASGAVVAPGFIDLHAHGGMQVLTNQTADSKIHDGVTTEVLGNCGSSPFPAGDDDAYPSAAAFFDAVDDAGTAINRACLAGQGSIRRFVLGRTSVLATPEDIRAMRREAERCLDEGAFGISSGLIYTPGCFASEDEIAEVVGAAADADALYATHLRSESNEIEKAIDEAEYVARTSGARLQISHVKLSGRRNWDKIDWLDERLHGLIDDGMDLGCDRYPYVAASTNIGVIVPSWVHDGSPEERMERLRDPDVRARVEKDVFDRHPEPDYWDNIVISAVPDGEDVTYNGQSMRQIAEMRDERPVDTVMNLLAAHRAKASAVFFSMAEANLRRILTWSFVAVASDARARVPRHDELVTRPHPRAYGTFARLLGRYARDERVLSLEEAVRRVTTLPAARLGLDDRGVLRPGAFADVTIFDPDEVIDRATFTDPHRTSAGIRTVIVNGEPVVEDGVHNGRLPGRMLRRE
ncbi:MAG: N-acyl-D-amino-acid deacylase family protein [bacterium]